MERRHTVNKLNIESCGSSITTPTTVRLSSGKSRYPEQSIYRSTHEFVMKLCFLVVSVNVSRSLQPGAELRLPSDPGGSARAPARNWPAAEHRELRLRSQPPPGSPDPGLCQPATRARHPPIRAQRQRALSHLQRVRTGESGGPRRGDSSSRVMDSTPAACEEKAAAVKAGPPLPHAPLLGLSSDLCLRRSARL